MANTTENGRDGAADAEALDVGVLSRREAIRRVGAMLGVGAFVGGTALLTACERERAAPRADSAGAARASTDASLREPIGDFTQQDVAFLDEVADTILPTTGTPGAKAAHTGHFMAVMVTSTYDPKDQRVFKAGMRTLDEESRKANGGKSFVEATPEQRLALLTRVDRETKSYMDAREAAERGRKGSASDKYLGDQRQENAPGAGDANPAPAISADAPTHYFRMMKELAMLGYFTSEIGMTKAQRYVESPGRYDPCAPYKPGDRAWAGHA